MSSEAQLHAAVADSEAEFAKALGLSATVAGILWRRGHRDIEGTRRFLEPRLADLTRPEAMADREIAAERLAAAIRRGESICVFGDYDCDGITSTAILTQALRALGATVYPLLASRFAGGYGVSAPAVERILATKAPLVVTCDCGTSDHASLRALVAEGREVIVIDHHLIPDEPLPAVAFLNPHRVDCGFAYKNMSSCGLALSVAGAVRTALGVPLDLLQWLDLVAIGTVADVVPLDGDNRALVRAGLKRLAERTRPGLSALMETLRLGQGAPVTSQDIAFRIAPRINAPGRVGSPEPALELLLAASPADGSAAAARVEQLQSERRRIQDEMIAQALADVAHLNLAERDAIVVGQEGWNHGIVGVVAGRLSDTFQRPVVVVGFSDGLGRGSVRGPSGSRLHDALGRCQHLLERFGGHQAAAGLDIRRPHFEDFRQCFEEACRSLSAEVADGTSPSDNSATTLLEGDTLQQVHADLERLEPFGSGNPPVRLLVEATVNAVRTVRGGHLKLELTCYGQRVGAFAAGMAEQAPLAGSRVSVQGTLRRDAWRGGSALEIVVDRLLAQ
jgi:single-stranded-DNA-specific exonuclease